MKNLLGFGLLIFTTCMLAGCNHPSQNLAVTVQDVRIVAAVTSKGNDNTVGGAILGGMVAGTKGAVIGALAGSDSTITTTTELKGCSLTTTINGRRVRFTSIGSQLPACSLEFKGDKVLVQFFPNGNFDYSGEQYVWHGVYGEVLPNL